MVEPRVAIRTVTFVDNYCGLYEDLFPEVRSFEAFKYLHLGMISEIPRKSLPAIAKVVGLANHQMLHHFLTESPWDIDALRKQRLGLILQQLQGEPITLVIDETGDRKKGKSTDYVDRQYIGNLGKIDNGIVSVNAYGIWKTMTFPLLFKIYKPRKRLKPDDIYQSKIELAKSMIKELKDFGFHFNLVLSDSLYGESRSFVRLLDELRYPWVVAIRSNHGVWLPENQRVRTTRWKAFERIFSNGKSQVRYGQEIIFGQRHDWRYWRITTNPETVPENSTWYLMSHVSDDLNQQVGNLYGLRTWIEYGFKQSKNHLGWADFRLTHYQHIERWWEVVQSAYLMVSLQFNGLRGTHPQPPESNQAALLSQFSQHPHWTHHLSTWKHRLNNLQLIIQPFIDYCSIKPWLKVFDSWPLRVGFSRLIKIMNDFIGYVPSGVKQGHGFFSSA